jgi:glycosyl transferase family 25
MQRRLSSGASRNSSPANLLTALKIFVISLPDAHERRERAARQLEELGLAFEFFDAMRGEQVMAKGYFEHCDEEEWLLNTGHPMSLGEVGCFASHRSMWQKCVELGEPLMIMEDDFQLLPGFAGAVEKVAGNISEFGFIRLQTETRARKRRIASLGKYTLWRYTKVPHSCMCNSMTPEVAQNLVDQTRAIVEPVDVFIKKFWVHGQPIFGLTPYTVTESTLSQDTYILHREKVPKGFGRSARRFLRKCSWELKRLRAARRMAASDRGQR